ncbi:MAG: hypothetical protein AAGF97_19840, partial [Planctomycetota bacterium]
MTCALLIAALLPTLAGELPRAAAARAEQDAAYHQQLEQLATRLQEEGQGEAAAVVSQWIAPKLQDRQRLFLSTTRLTDPDGQPTGEVPGWQREFEALRARRAESLWSFAEEAVESGDLETAVQTVHEIYREDPNNERAAKFLRWHLIDPAEIRSKPVRSPHKEFGWAGGQHSLITTPHFLIHTNHSEQAGRELAMLLEETYQVWSQVFVRHWTDAADVRRAFEDRSLPAASRRRHRVVLFADRDEYVDHLRKREPQIELSSGMYRPAEQTAYFFAGPRVEKYWRHELVHQLLAETGRVRHPKRSAPPGSDAHAWLIEGIAVYFESARREPDAILLGGFESARLQFARYRLLQEGFYLPPMELMSLGREALKQHPEIRKIYTQSAGLVHYLMDGDRGKHRQALIDAVRQLYQEPKAVQPLDSLESIDRNYRAFLMVDDKRFDRLRFPQQITELCLGQTEVTDQIADKVASLTQLEWLDLAACDVGDEVVAAIPSTAPLRQL